MADLVTLERSMYSEALAARLLRVHQSTLHYWLEGGRQGGKVHPPVIREAATGSRDVTWGEFVEAGLLREYRRVEKMALREVRSFITDLRERLQVKYPLAHRRPYIGEGAQFVEEAQTATHLPPELSLVTRVGNQLVLLPASDAFVRRVEWNEDIAAGWRPHEDSGSPVRMRPNVRSGLPAVGGIRTEIIWEHLDAEESVDEVAAQFELTEAEVRWAFAYETSLRHGEPQPAAA